MKLNQEWVGLLLGGVGLFSAGFIFLSSMLVTTYQQYLSYLEVESLSGIGVTLEEIQNVDRNNANEKI